MYISIIKETRLDSSGAETTLNKHLVCCKEVFDLNQGLLKPGEKHPHLPVPLPQHTEDYGGRAIPSAAPCGPSDDLQLPTDSSLAKLFKRQLWIKALYLCVLLAKLGEMSYEKALN